jgi:hypothetical protein
MMRAVERIISRFHDRIVPARTIAEELIAPAMPTPAITLSTGV